MPKGWLNWYGFSLRPITWIIVIILPVILVAGVVALILGKAPTPELHGDQLYSSTGIFLTYLTFFLFVGFAYYYFFKIRKKGELSVQYKFNLILLYSVIFLLLAYRIELAEKNYILAHIRYSETTVCLYDADTKKLLLDNISCSGFGRTSGQILPLKSSRTSVTEKGFRFELIDIKPNELTFSAPGYKSKKVFVGTQEGKQTISVYLEKENLNDPNQLAIP